MHPVIAEIFNSAKGYIHKSTLGMGLVFRARGSRGVSLQELDRRIDEAMVGTVGDTPESLEELSKLVSQLYRSTYLKLPKRFRMPPDPFSPEYAERQRELYAYIAERPYAPENETPPYDQEKAGGDFFPYSTRSPEFVGRELLSYGFLIRNMGLKPGSKIVEFGPGLGNITLHLAMMGHEMTAVEVSRLSAEMIRHRAILHNRSIRVVEQDMVEFAAHTEERFDAALFLASLHHCHDHPRLLEHLRRIVKDDGVIYFAMEHVIPAQTPAFPYPWGLLLDGGSLFYIRRHGSLEQGFEAAYFHEALRKVGWKASRVPSRISGIEDLYVARRIPLG